MTKTNETNIQKSTQLGIIRGWRYAGRNGWWLGLVLILVTALVLPALKDSGRDNMLVFFLLDFDRVKILILVILILFSRMLIMVILFLIATSFISDVLIDLLLDSFIGSALKFIARALIHIDIIPSTITFIDSAFVVAFLLYVLDCYIYALCYPKNQNLLYNFLFIVAAVTFLHVLGLIMPQDKGLGLTDTVSRLLLNPTRWARVNEIKNGKIELYHYDCYSVAPISRWLATNESVTISAISERLVELRFIQAFGDSSQCYYLDLGKLPNRLNQPNPNYIGSNISYNGFYASFPESLVIKQKSCFASRELQHRLPELLRTATWDHGWLDYQFIAECRP